MKEKLFIALSWVLLGTLAFAQNSDILLNLTLTDIPPIVSSVLYSVTTSTATITWSTDIPADSMIQYGTTSAYGSSTTLDARLVIDHSMSINGLQPGVAYHYSILSANSKGIYKPTPDSTFTTQAFQDTAAPKILNLKASQINNTSERITWNTDEPSWARIDYGTTSSYGMFVENRTLMSSSKGILANLKPKTMYHYKITVRDAAGNTNFSSDKTFKTAFKYNGLILSGEITSGSIITGAAPGRYPCVDCSVVVTVDGITASARTDNKGRYSVVLSEGFDPGSYIADITIDTGLQVKKFSKRLTLP